MIGIQTCWGYYWIRDQKTLRGVCVQHICVGWAHVTIFSAFCVVFLALLAFILCLLCPILHVFVDCSYLIPSFYFSDVY